MVFGEHIVRAQARRSFACAGWRLGLLGAAGAVLAGCGMSDGAGALFVDPGHYSAYRCNEIADRWKVVLAREKELHGLMEKASEGGGGAFIGSLAYRSDYETTLAEERLLQRAATAKNCGFTPEFQSDRTIR